MNKLVYILLSFFVLGCMTTSAQTHKYAITNSGWGRLEKGFKVAITSYESSISELDIHRWRKVKGELTIDEEDKLLTVRLPRKEIVYTLLTESYVHKDRSGWSYVERQALENDRTFCRVWICTHEDGSQQVLILYNNFVQGYKLSPVD